MLKLKIALLSYRSDPFSGGQGIYLKNLSDALIRRCHKITIFSGNPLPDVNKNVDLIEIGMPFSDPIADGPIIQYSSNVAIDNGMNLHVLFKQLANIRKITNIPIILIGYVNPVYQFGYDKFINKGTKNKKNEFVITKNTNIDKILKKIF